MALERIAPLRTQTDAELAALGPAPSAMSPAHLLREIADQVAVKWVPPFPPLVVPVSDGAWGSKAWSARQTDTRAAFDSWFADFTHPQHSFYWGEIERVINSAFNNGTPMKTVRFMRASHTVVAAVKDVYHSALVRVMPRLHAVSDTELDRLLGSDGGTNVSGVTQTVAGMMMVHCVAPAFNVVAALHLGPNDLVEAPAAAAQRAALEVRRQRLEDAHGTISNFGANTGWWRERRVNEGAEHMAAAAREAERVAVAAREAGRMAAAARDAERVAAAAWKGGAPSTSAPSSSASAARALVNEHLLHEVGGIGAEMVRREYDIAAFADAEAALGQGVHRVEIEEAGGSERVAAVALEAVEVRARAVIAPLLGMGAVERKLFDSLRSSNRFSSFELKAGSWGLRSEGMRILANALRSGAAPHLMTLNVGNSKIGADGARALATALVSLPQLTTLNVSWNSIGVDGARALATALVSLPHLTMLHVSDNNIGVDGARALVSALISVPQLTSLNLNNNSIGVDGARSLAVALGSVPQLTTLDVGGNSIGDDGARALAAALVSVPQLTTLDVNCNSIGVDGERVLRAAFPLIKV